MVYTYNQGVLLSGLRGLWEASGNISYLEDGHELVRNVIRATGWTRSGSRSPSSSSTNSQQRQSKVSENKEEALPTDWAGLGYNGVLTESCDPSGRCSQDGQTFKGIFFHHLTSFCNPLPSRPTRPGKTHAATRETAMLHANSCREYTTWVTHNAQAALQTRDEAGRFGSWWGAPQTPFPSSSHHRKASASDGRPSLPQNATDYRNMHTQPDDGMYMEGEFQEPSEWSIFNEDVENEITRRGGGHTTPKPPFRRVMKQEDSDHGGALHRHRFHPPRTIAKHLLLTDALPSHRTQQTTVTCIRSPMMACTWKASSRSPLSGPSSTKTLRMKSQGGVGAISTTVAAAAQSRHKAVVLQSCERCGSFCAEQKEQRPSRCE